MTTILIAVVALVALGLVLWRKHHPSEPAGWAVGPLVNGVNYSHGVTLDALAGGVWAVRIVPGAELDGVTRARGSGDLANAKAIHVRYRVTGDSLYPSEQPTETPMLTLYFQREGDDWQDDKQDYRWYSSTPLPLTPGEHGATYPLDPAQWGSMMGRSGTDQLPAFAAALASPGRIGLGFGWAAGRMHGVESRALVNFELVEWAIV